MARFSSLTELSDIGSADIIPITHLQDNTDYKVKIETLVTKSMAGIPELANITDLSNADTAVIVHNGVAYQGTIGELLKTAVAEINATTIKQDGNVVLDTSSVLSALDTTSDMPVNSTAVKSLINDEAVSTDTAYSSSKIESDFATIKDSADVSVAVKVYRADLNNVGIGYYRCTTECSNLPVAEGGYVHTIIRGEGFKFQTYMSDSGVTYTRCKKVVATWGDWQQLATADKYSTTETKTDKIWIDGKSIYRKVIRATLTSNAENEIANAVSSFDTIIDIKGMVVQSDKKWIPINYYVDSTNRNVYWLKSDGTLVIKTGTTGSGIAKIIIEYTKATD